MATFAVLHLVLQVFCPPPGLFARRRGGFDRFMEVLWPRREPLRWPPPETSWLTSEDEFVDLTSAFEYQRPE